MSKSQLPERASLDYLKKLAKQRLRELREADPAARLHAAQLVIARDHGFASWRALKTEIDRRRGPLVAAVFAACRAGNAAALRALVDDEPGLVHDRDAGGSTPLHAAVGRVELVEILLARGADPDARDTGDNATPLHVAAGGGHLASLRALLDAGGDVHGTGDVHRREVIGWATDRIEPPRDVVALLVERGARHHIFSAIAMGDPGLVQDLVERDPAALARRRSRFEQSQTALHYTIVPPDGLAPRAAMPQYDMLELLIELGADLDATDDRGRTALAAAMLRGDVEAMRRLHAAGARPPASPVATSGSRGGPRAPREPVDARTAAPSPAALGGSVRTQLTAMLRVADMATTLAWYTAIGFEIAASHAHDGAIDWARLAFGASTLMISPGRRTADPQTSLWIATDRIDDVYRALEDRQLRWAEAALAGAEPPHPEIRFVEDLHAAFYGGREFTVRDPDGYDLVFHQPR